MSTESHNTEFGKLIASAIHAERSGVFERTELDVARLVTPPQPSRLMKFYERAMVGLPLAACLGIVVGIASLTTHSGQFTGSHVAMVDTNGAGSGMMTVSQAAGAELMPACVAGPGHPVANGCTSADLDADGDVDLHDWGAYQTLASAAQ